MGARKGPEGSGQTVAEAGCAVDHGDGQILCERRVLQTVVHDDDRSPLARRELRATRTVAGDDSRTEAGDRRMVRLRPRRPGERR